MKILVTSATEQELAIAKAYYIKHQQSFLKKKQNILFATTGVGMLASTVGLMQLLFTEKPDLVIQAGIAGAFNSNLKLGKVVLVEHEIIGDLGVEENGQWKDLFDMKFQQANAFPYKKKLLTNKKLHELNVTNLPIVTAITVNQISTNSNRIALLQNKYNPAIESMEGAALHYVALVNKVAFLQIRSISNYVGERDKSKWVLQKSIKQLNNSVIKHLKLITK